MRKFIKYIFMAFFAATIFVSAEASAQGGNARSGLTGAAYLASYNHHTVAIRGVSSAGGVGQFGFTTYTVPGPSSLALFSTALAILGIGGLVRRRRGRR